MRALVFLGHPRSVSFNHAIAERAVGVLREAGHTAMLRVLYAEEFSPGSGWRS